MERCLGVSYRLYKRTASDLSNYAQSAIANHVRPCFGFTVILKRIFQQKTICTDAVIGALCGYLLAVAWAAARERPFARPGSFRVARDRRTSRRLYCNASCLLSVTTHVFSYSDITRRALALSLSSRIRQFYIWVVVAQLASYEPISRGRIGDGDWNAGMLEY
jgi:hypothetical protein